MAKIKGEVDVIPEDEAILNQTFLVEVNAERVNLGLPPFASMDAYATFVLGNALSNYVSNSKAKKAKTIADRYDAAPAAVKAQVDALLG